MKSIEEFAKWAREVMQEKHPKDTVRVQPITSSTRSYLGLTVESAGTSAAPVIDLTHLYELYCEDAEEEELIDIMEDSLQQSLPFFDPSDFMDYEKVKKNLVIRICNAEQSKELLKRVPHERRADLALTYHTIVPNHPEISTMVTHEMLQHYSVTPVRLSKDAMRSSPKICPAVVRDLNEVMAEFGVDGIPENTVKTILVTAAFSCDGGMQNTHGAAALFYPGVLDRVAEELGGEITIIPSSVHEFLVLRYDPERVEERKEMVRFVNDTEVMPEDRLSYNIYHYSKEGKRFETVEEYRRGRRS